MKKTIVFIISFIFSCILSIGAYAQYFDWGQDPSSVKWMQIKTENGKFVFPDKYTVHAVRLMHYMDTIRPQINYGFRYGPINIPVLTHTQNFSSNGLVMLAPKRMELITMPPSTTAAMPWLKQLAVHEYRHAVQYNNANRGAIKVLSYILGQQGSLVGMAFFPYWAVEGDAVMAETQFSSFGRGLQPSFTIDYRALALEGEKEYSIDKYFCGSYKDNLPDHYHLGYQLTSWAYTRYGNDYWAKVLDYGVRKPYILFTAKVAQRKYFGSSSDKLFKGTFDDLNRFWRSMPIENNSARIINTPNTSFTTYSTPIAVSSTKIVALKSDFDRFSRIVEVDIESGEEKTLHHTGVINTGLSYADGVLWWSELRQSTFWEQRVNSQICWYDMMSGKSGVADGARRQMYPVGMPDKNYAAVDYDYSGKYFIKYGDRRVEIPDTISVHGLAYDKNSESFYFIGLSDGGMWIGGIKAGQTEFSKITEGSYSTISSLRASGGKLYYRSIASGKDEAHMYNIAAGKEYRITRSRYGSFDPFPVEGTEEALVTVYTPQGYLLARQDVSEVNEEVQWSKLPQNTINPDRVKWDVMNIDSVVVADTTVRKVSKFRKCTHLCQFHSWAPVHYEPDKILSESEFNVNLGVTLLSQNLLNTTFTTLGYKYTDEGSFFTAGIRFHGLAPKFEIDAEYGLMDQLIYAPPGALPPARISNNRFNLTAKAYLPILLSSGYVMRWLTPMVEFQHDNIKLFYPFGADNQFPAMFDPRPPKYRNGIQKMILTLQYSQSVRMAYRDFLPKWGYAVRLRHTSSPFNDNFGKIWTGYVRGYLPGISKHHSLMLRGALQKQSSSTYGFRQKELFPRGADYTITPEKYISGSIDYQLPVWYPDGGISSLLYFKRIRLNLFGDYARFIDFKEPDKWENVYSYGLDMTFDIVPLRLPPNTNTAVTISIRKPSDRKGVVFAAGLVMPI